MKMCATAATGATIINYISGILGGGGGGIGAPLGGSNSKSNAGTVYPVVTKQTFSMCNPCDAKKAEDLFEVLIGKTFLAPVNTAMNVSYDIEKNKSNQEKQVLIVTKSQLENLRDALIEAAKHYFDYRTGLPVSDMYDLGEGIWDIIKVIKISSRPCPDPEQNQNQKSLARVKSKESDERSWQKEYDEVAASFDVSYFCNHRPSNEIV